MENDNWTWETGDKILILNFEFEFWSLIVAVLLSEEGVKEGV